jgi:hypothetical protein
VPVLAAGFAAPNRPVPGAAELCVALVLPNMFPAVVVEVPVVPAAFVVAVALGVAADVAVEPKSPPDEAGCELDAVSIGRQLRKYQAGRRKERIGS